MRIETSRDEEQFVVRIAGERKPKAIYRLIGSIALSLFLELGLRHSWATAMGVIAGGSFAIYTFFEVQFGSSEMRVDDHNVRFITRIPGFKRTRVFQRSDVERLGYLKGSKEDPPALGIMIRTLMLPLRFGHGLTHEEATDLLSAIASTECWIAKKTLHVDRPLF